MYTVNDTLYICLRVNHSLISKSIWALLLSVEDANKDRVFVNPLAWRSKGMTKRRRRIPHGPREPDWGKKFGISVPSKHTTLHEQLTYCCELVKVELSHFDFQSTSHAIKIGQVLVFAEQLVRQRGKKRGTWAEYRRRYFPRAERKAQRCMRLARHIDVRHFPVLASMDQERLFRLIKLAGKNQDVGTFLEGQGIDLDLDIKDQEAIRQLKAEISRLVGMTPARVEGQLKREAASGPVTPDKIDHFQKSVRSAVECTRHLQSAFKDLKGTKKAVAKLDSDDLFSFRNDLTKIKDEVESLLDALDDLEEDIEDS
jgi:hypothetical protein